ncbi:MAG: TonB-dependent receptor [Mangrovibacterium sp.]
MKKNNAYGAWSKYAFKKTMRVMRLIVMLLFSGLFQLQAVNSFSQDKRINLDMENVSVMNVLRTIEEKSDFRFLFSSKVIDIERIISLKAENKNIEEVLRDIFDGTNTTYKVIDNKIVLSGESPEQVRPQGITGKVTDQSGQPLPGVTVVLKGTTTGTITNSDGRYSIPHVPDNAVLIFSFVGMQTMELPVEGKTEMNIELKADIVGLEEVVAIGYGVQKKVNLTGAVSSVTKKELEARPITNMTNALSGLATGVQVNQGDGQPGRDGATIRIRGIGTIGNSDPLILVDGVESTMSDISVDDVESISVLKDASASAIYGSRAANGVLLITTKKGEKGVLKVNYHGYAGFQEATRLESYLSDFATYMELNNEANKNVGLGNYYTENEINAWRQEPDPLKHPNVDWVDKVYGNTAFMHAHHLSFTGGGEHNVFNFSLGYTNQEGLVPTNKMERYNFRFNWEASISKTLSVGTNLSGTWTEIVDPANTEVFGIVPGIPWIQSEDGRWGGNQSNGTGTVTNPRAAWTNNSNNERTQRFLGKVFLNWEIAKGLTFNSNFAIRFYNSLRDSFLAKYDIWNFNDNAVVRTFGDPQTNMNKNVEDYTLTSYYTLNYTKVFADRHNLNLMAGYSLESYRGDQFQASVQNFHNNEIRVLDGGQENPQVGGSASESGLISYFGRLNYDYESKYLLEGNLRYDGSSRFRKGKRWGLYPSFSAGWRISEEGFMSGIGWLDNLKIRASWGRLGNQEIGLYPYQSVYSLNQNYTFGGSVASGIAQTAVANSDIEWETTTSGDFGIDATLFNGKLNVTADYFHRLTDGILVQLPIPATLGDKDAPYQNLAEVKNTGWEFAASYADKIGKLKFSVGFNLTQVQNEVTKYLGDVPFYSGPFIIREGLPMYSVFGYEYSGIIRSQTELDELNANAGRISGDPGAYFITNKTAPGDLKFKDQLTVDTNADGIPDASDGKINSDDRAVIGNTIPKFMYGLNITANYKGIDLAALFQGVQEVDGYLSGAGVMPFGVNGDRGQTPSKWTDRWTTNNPDASLPRLTNNRGYTWNDQTSSFWMQDGSFLRLKSLQIGYSLPQSLLSAIHVDRVRFYVNGENLFTWTSFDGWDPERSQRETEITYPNVKTVSFGAQITF